MRFGWRSAVCSDSHAPLPLPLFTSSIWWWSVSVSIWRDSFFRDDTHTRAHAAGKEGGFDPITKSNWKTHVVSFPVKGKERERERERKSDSQRKERKVQRWPAAGEWRKWNPVMVLSWCKMAWFWFSFSFTLFHFDWRWRKDVGGDVAIDDDPAFFFFQPAPPPEAQAPQSPI